MKHNQIKIMVVEDEVLVGIMLVRKLRSFGYEVGEPITSGEEAIERAGCDSPEVILMDVTLAGAMNGLQAARIIRQQYHIPSIIFSGYDHAGLNGQTEEVEPVTVVSKLGTMEELRVAIEKIVGKG